MANINPDDVSRIIVLTHGLMEDGGNYWCYVSVKPSRHQEFQRAIANQYNIQQFANDGYGEVIVSGRGDDPPSDVTQKVAVLFGVAAETFFTDTDIEATLADKLAKLQASE